MLEMKLKNKQQIYVLTTPMANKRRNKNTQARETQTRTIGADESASM